MTHIVARYAATSPLEQVPDNVRKEAARTLFNWVGCAVGGSRQDAPSRAVAALKPFSGPEQAGLFGRNERLDALHAALVNGISSHVLDYDDTHLKTIIHPAGPVAAALTAFSPYRPVSGAEFMHALVLGCEPLSAASKDLHIHGSGMIHVPWPVSKPRRSVGSFPRRCAWRSCAPCRSNRRA